MEIEDEKRVVLERLKAQEIKHLEEKEEKDKIIQNLEKERREEKEKKMQNKRENRMGEEEISSHEKEIEITATGSGEPYEIVETSSDTPDERKDGVIELLQNNSPDLQKVTAKANFFLCISQKSVHLINFPNPFLLLISSTHTTPLEVTSMKSHNLS